MLLIERHATLGFRDGVWRVVDDLAVQLVGVADLDRVQTVQTVQAFETVETFETVGLLLASVNR